MTYPHPRWAESMNVLYELFPKWSPSDEQIAIWREAFGNVNQDWLQQAFRRHFEQSGRFTSPTIEGVRKTWDEVVNGERVRTVPPGHYVPEEPQPFTNARAMILAELREQPIETVHRWRSEVMERATASPGRWDNESDDLDDWDPMLRWSIWALKLG